METVCKASPVRGGVAAGDGRVHCRFAAEISCKAWQGLAPCFVGDDACIVPETLRYRKAFAAGVNARPTLRPGTGGNAEAAANRQDWRRNDACIVPETLRYRKAFAAGVNARPTLRPGTGGNAEAAANRQDWRRNDACIVPETLRYRKAFAAGVNARPTLRPGTRGNVEAVVRRQARPRADASIGPYAGGSAGLAGRCQAPPPRRGTSRRRLAAAQGARRPAKRIVSLRDQKSAGG